MKIEVEYNSNISINELSYEISKISFPQIIIWYIGVNGLKKNCSEFYKNSLIDPLIEQGKNPFFWMLDLTAWKALTNSKISIHKSSKIAEKINEIGSSYYKCIHSAHIFRKMQNVSDEIMVNYLKKSLRRDFIWKSSENIACSNIDLGSVFENQCSLFSDWYHIDSNKFYSVLQYFECFFLVDEIISSSIENGKINNIFNIIFTLPNDEIKFYFNEGNSFEDDINFFISYFYGNALKEKLIKISFVSFKYGDEIYHRPYNSPGETLKSNRFSMHHCSSY